MSTVRTFGTTLGPGTRVREVAPSRPIAEGPFGTTLFVGEFRSGPINRPILCATLGDFLAVYGGKNLVGDAALNVEHFFEAGGGAGKCWVQRVGVYGSSEDAGSNVAGRSGRGWVYARNVSQGWTKAAANGSATEPRLLANVSSIAAGARYGADRVLELRSVTPSAVISGSTVNLSSVASDVGDADGEWVGAKLYIDAFPTKVWTVASYDGRTGQKVLSILGSFPADVAAYATPTTFRLERASVDRLTQKAEGFGLAWTDSGEGRANRFGAVLYGDGSDVYAQHEELTVKSGVSGYWKDAFGGDAGGDFVVLSSVATSLDDENTLLRPANRCEIQIPRLPDDGEGGSFFRLNTVRWWRQSGAADIYLRPETVTQPSKARVCVVVCTFTSGTAFDVEIEEPHGYVTALGSGTVGTEFDGGDYYPTFTLRKKAGGSNPSTGHTIRILSRPMPTQATAMTEVWLSKAVAPRGRYRAFVAPNGEVLPVGSREESIQECVPPKLLGGTLEPYDLSAGSLTFKFTVNGGTERTLTTSLSGASTTATALAADLNARELARVSGVAEDVEVVFYNADGVLGFYTHGNYGSAATLAVGNGTLDAVLGFTNGTTATGTDGDLLRLEWAEKLVGAADTALTDEEYRLAWAVLPTFLSGMVEQNTGAIKVAMPGVTEGGVQGLMQGWAYNVNAVAYCEVPPAYPLGQAREWHAANLRAAPSADHHAVLFPSYLQIPNPYGSGLYEAPITGYVLGLEAKAAVDARGYHRAPAGMGFRIGIAKALPSVLRILGAGGTASWLEQANAYGFRPIRVKGGDFFVYGDRIPGFQRRIWLHKRLTLSHIGRVLLTNLDGFHFAPNDQATWSDVKAAFREVFEPWVRAGWFFSAAGGTDVEDFVAIRVDGALNDQATRSAGVMKAAVGFEIVDTAETVEVTLGPSSIEVRE